MTLRLALLGCGIGRSLSPVLHQAAGLSLGRAVDFRLFDFQAQLDPSGLADALSLFFKADGPIASLDGFSVTAPLKQLVMPQMHHLSAPATRLGAVNAVSIRAGRRLGHNTDLEGFNLALGPLPIGRAVVLGAGGAARAVVAVLADRGALVHVVNRDEQKAQDLLAALTSDRGTYHRWDDCRRAFEEADLVVQCGSGGPAILRPENLPFGVCRRSARAFDLNYRPRVTPFLKAAASFGLGTLSGLDMLIYQGVAAFEGFSGERPELEAVRSAVYAALD
ncbi:MAG: hypothetical protein EXR76_06350 [Myxococcales bacterium]|nr:hypothetical protein [Myxococcales bacterium]